MSESDPALTQGLRLKRRPYTRLWNVMLGILAILGYVWQAFDWWSNLEFISQKSGLLWKVLYFVFATQTGANIISVIFVALFVTSLLFQFERRPQLPPPDDPTPPALTAPSGTAPALLEGNKEPEERPNLVFKGIEYLATHWMYGFLQEGPNPDSNSRQSDLRALTIAVENEFSDTFKVADVRNVTAQIFYRTETGETFQFNRGAWLENGNRANFRANDIRHLIIAVWVGGYDPLACAIVREYREDRKSLDKIVQLLPENFYGIKVRVISENAPPIHLEKELVLEITQKPKFLVNLYSTERLQPNQILQRLEQYLSEGNTLLRSFPKEKERTPEDDEKVASFERQVANFLATYPERFSVASFLSDIPVIKYSGVAHSSNWPSLNRLTTRIARLRDMVDEARKS